MAQWPRAEDFLVQYQGRILHFHHLIDHRTGAPAGYTYAHPPRGHRVCQWNWVPNVVPMVLICPQGCGWRIRIVNNVAYDL